MDKIRILAVIPYKGLGETICAVAEEEYGAEVEIIVQVANLGEAEEFLLGYDAEFDAILSRGGTCEVLRRVATVPVVNVEVSGYDYVRAIKLTQLHAGKVAVAGFSNITRNASVANELLQSGAEIVTFEREDEVAGMLKRIRGEGVGVVIGDVITVEMAGELGIYGVLLTSGRESVRSAIEHAVNTVRAVRSARRREAMLAAVLAQSGSCVAVLSAHGKWLHSIPGEKAQAARELHLETLCAPVMAGKTISRIVELERGAHLLTGVHIREGWYGQEAAAFYLEPCIEALSGQALVSEAVGDNDRAGVLLFENSRSGAEYIKRGLALLESGGPLLVEGEFGTGKGVFVRTLHQKGEWRHSMLLTLNCEEPTAAAELEAAVQAGLFRGEGAGMLHVRLVNRLPRKDHERLYRVLRRLRGMCIVVTSSDSIGRLAAQGLFSEALCAWLIKSPVLLAPLRERRDDIDSLAAMYIAECNDKTGRQVIGFEPDALALLRSSPWPFNIEQLKTAVERMTLFCVGSYIPKHLVRAEVAAPSESLFSNQYVSITDKTLDEITVDAIAAVLRDEDMNQVRAANRLGIARSTLWRKLK